VLGFLFDATLIAFEAKEVIAAPLLGDEPSAFLLAVHRVGGG
jgi:hypothetical protein